MPKYSSLNFNPNGFVIVLVILKTFKSYNKDSLVITKVCASTVTANNYIDELNLYASDLENCFTDRKY